MDVPENLKQGKNVLVKALTPNSNELNVPIFQKLMHRINNCNATVWKCAYCRFGKRMNCFKNVKEYLLMDAHKKYGDTPQIKKATDDRIRAEKNKRATEVLGIKKDSE